MQLQLVEYYTSKLKENIARRSMVENLLMSVPASAKDPNTAKMLKELRTVNKVVKRCFEMLGYPQDDPEEDQKVDDFSLDEGGESNGQLLNVLAC